MSLLTPELLAKAVACPDPIAAAWAGPLGAAMDGAGLDTSARVAAFLAQVAHESCGLTAFEEGLNYKAEALGRIFKKYFPTPELAAEYAHKPERIANRVYASRMGNGPEESGDGARYKGRGPIQITGRESYFSCGKAIGVDLIASPECLLIPGNGAASAAWFWTTRKLNDLADAGDFEAITKRINGGLNGQDDRLARWARAKAALGV